MSLSPAERAYNRLVKIFDRAGFQVWSPNGHLNQSLSEAAGDILADDNPGWDHGIKESLPLNATIDFTNDSQAAALLGRMKIALQKRGFTITEELPNLSDGFSALAEGVRAHKIPSHERGKHKLEIIISQLPEPIA